VLDLVAQETRITETLDIWRGRDPEPEDFTQEVWVRLVEVRHLYDSGRGTVEAFVMRVARSVWVGRLRYDQALKRTPVVDATEPLYSPEPKPAPKPFKAYLLEHTDFEDVEPRRVYKLLSMGYTRREICDCLDLTLYQVNQAKAHLRTLFERYEGP